MGGADFEVILQLATFLFAIWGGGWLFGKIRLPPIIGQFVMGILLGPQMLDIVPYASTGHCENRLINPWEPPHEDTHRILGEAPTLFGMSTEFPFNRRRLAGAKTCTDVKWERFEDGKYISNIWTMIGNIGVTLMIMESGMHIHFDKVRQVGSKAFVVAIFGTLLPIVVGLAVTGLISDGDRAFYPLGFSAGCAFAPTSVGISISLLEDSKMLGSKPGQTTITAAFIDDVFSLVTLVLLKQMAKGVSTLKAEDIVVPIILSFAFLGFSVFAAIKIFVHLDKLLDLVPYKKYVSIQPREQLHLAIMLLVLCFFGWFTSNSFIGSHLLGAFGAGMCFVNVDRSHTVWQSQMKRVIRWTVKIFFAASVGFAVPVETMGSAKAIWQGVVLGLVPTIGAKIISGLFAYLPYESEARRELAIKASWVCRFVQPQQLLVGMAMVARGEFAYLVAAEAVSLVDKDNSSPDCEEDNSCQYMLDDDTYAAVMWALVMATVTSPILFKWALGVFERATPVVRSRQITGSLNTCVGGKAFVIRIGGSFHPNVRREIFDGLYHSGVDVLEGTMHCVNQDGDTQQEDFKGSFVDTLVVVARGAKKDFDEDKLHEIHHELSEILHDRDADIRFEPATVEFSHFGMIELDIFGSTSIEVHIQNEIVGALTKLGLEALVVQSKIHGEAQAFYVRERNITGKSYIEITAKRREEITKKCKEIMAQEHLESNSVVVKVLHESEMEESAHFVASPSGRHTDPGHIRSSTADDGVRQMPKVTKIEPSLPEVADA